MISPFYILLPRNMQCVEIKTTKLEQTDYSEIAIAKKLAAHLVYGDSKAAREVGKLCSERKGRLRCALTGLACVWKLQVEWMHWQEVVLL